MLCASYRRIPGSRGQNGQRLELSVVANPPMLGFMVVQSAKTVGMLTGT